MASLPAGNLFLRETQQEAEGFVDGFGISEYLGYVGLEKNHVRARSIGLVMLPPHSLGEIILGPKIVRLILGPLTHIAFVPAVSLPSR